MRFIAFVLSVFFIIILTYGAEDSLSVPSLREEITKDDSLKTEPSVIAIEDTLESKKTEAITDTFDLKQESAKKEVTTEKSKQMVTSEEDKQELEDNKDVSGLDENIFPGDSIYDKFGRLSRYKTFQYKYEKFKKKRVKVPVNLIEFTYEDEIYNKIGAFHVGLGTLSVGYGIAGLVIGIVNKSKSTAILSGVPIILGTIEISLGVLCISHQKKFWQLHKKRHKKIKKAVPPDWSGQKQKNPDL